MEHVAIRSLWHNIMLASSASLSTQPSCNAVVSRRIGKLGLEKLIADGRSHHIGNAAECLELVHVYLRTTQAAELALQP